MINLCANNFNLFFQIKLDVQVEEEGFRGKELVIASGKVLPQTKRLPVQAPLSSEHGTHKTDNTRFWLGFQAKALKTI